MFDRVDHIGIAVVDLDASVQFYEQTLGMGLIHREVLEDHGVEVALLSVGENHIELLRPLHENTAVGHFLVTRGPGMHHIAYQVTDIVSTLARLKERGVVLVDDKPRPGICDSLVAFVHPASAGGVLIEVVQPAASNK